MKRVKPQTEFCASSDRMTKTRELLIQVKIQSDTKITDDDLVGIDTDSVTIKSSRQETK